MKSKQIHLSYYPRSGTTFFIKNSKILFPSSLIVSYATGNGIQKFLNNKSLFHFSIIRNPIDLISSEVTLEMMKNVESVNRIEYRSIKRIDLLENFYNSIKENEHVSIFDFNDLVLKPKELFSYLAKNNDVQLNNKDIVKVSPMPNVFFASAKEVESYEKVRDVILNNVDLYKINKMYDELINKKFVIS